MIMSQRTIVGGLARPAEAMAYGVDSLHRCVQLPGVMRQQAQQDEAPAGPERPRILNRPGARNPGLGAHAL